MNLLPFNQFSRFRANPAPAVEAKKQDPTDGVFLKPESMRFVNKALDNGYKVEVLDRDGKFTPINDAKAARSDEALILTYHEGSSKVVNLFAQYSNESLANDMNEKELNTKLSINSRSHEAHLDKQGNVYINGEKVYNPFENSGYKAPSLEKLYRSVGATEEAIRGLMQVHSNLEKKAA